MNFMKFIGHMFVTNYTQYQCRPSSSVSLFTSYLGLFITVLSEPRPLGLSSIFTPQFCSCHPVISSRTDHNRYMKTLYMHTGCMLSCLKLYLMITKYKYLSQALSIQKQFKQQFWPILAMKYRGISLILGYGHCGPVTDYLLSTQ